MKNKFKSDPDSMTVVWPGFSETRRRMLGLPAALAAALILERAGIGIANDLPPGQTTTGNGADGDGRLDWTSFQTQCEPIAQELHKDSSPPGQEAYLHWIASMIVRARAGEIPRAKVGRFGKLEPAVRFGVSYRSKPFFIVEWQLEPGAFLPPHCHPNASVCTLGLEGEARIRNFEVVGQAPEFSSRKTFLVRETHNEIIAPGRINTLSSMRDNIHTFQAGRNGARGIDISTLHGPDVGFSFLEIARVSREAARSIFEAAWRDQPG
jgi:hypothetical protein